MADIKEVGKNPLDGAFGKLKEASANELQKKLSDKIKEVRSAKKIYDTLKGEFASLIKEAEVEKLELNDLLKELKSL